MGLLGLNFERLSHILPTASLEERRIGMSLTLHNLNSFAKRYVVAHFITAALVGYYCGFTTGAVVFIIMLLNASGLKVILEEIIPEFEKNKIDVNEAEKKLWIHPFSRSLISGVIYILFVNSGNEHSTATAAFFAGATIIIILNQTAGNLKFLLAGLLPVLVFIVADAARHVIILQSITPAIAPITFVFLMTSISLIVAKDKIKGANLILSNIEKNRALTESLNKLEQQQKTQTTVEKLARVGKFSWYFSATKPSYWSPGAFDAFGFEWQGVDTPPPKEAFMAQICDIDKREYMEVMADCRFNGKPYEFKFSLKNKNGDIRHVITNGAPILDESGVTIGMEGIVVDQTELRTALDDAERAQKLLKMALIQGKSAVTIHRHKTEDYSSMIGYGDLSNLGLEPEEYKGDISKLVIRNIEEDDLEIIMSAVDRSIKTKTPQTIEHKVIMNDGTIKYLRVVVSVEEHDDEGNLVISINTDITDEVRNRVELSKALQNADQAQKLLQMALVQGRSVVLVNDFANDFAIGYGALDIVGIDSENKDRLSPHDVMRSLSPIDRKKLIDAAVISEQTGQTQTIEHQMKNTSGTNSNLRVSLSAEGKISQGAGKVITISTEISEEIERRNQISAALEAANNASRVKSEFLANMSHEIRTPLNGVVAVAGMLANTKLDKTQKDMVELIVSSSSALNQILNDVLDLARVESGRLEISKTSFNLKDALNSVIALFGVKADEKGLEFEVDIPSEANANFIGDPTRIRQILSNYISNAVKFTSKGKVSLRTSIAPCKNNADCLEVRFDVCDTGNGIPKEALKKLFGRFEQGDGSITREHGGSGLGLAISKGLAELMGGKVEAKSTIGKGSVFSLILPLHATQEQKLNSANEIVDAEIANNQTTAIDDMNDEYNEDEVSLNILGVDDNVTNRKVLDMVLAPIGVNLKLCNNGLEAVEAYSHENFDVVLMDLQMPVMDGLSAIREIRKFETAGNRHHTPIIAVSANAMTHHVAEALEAGADYHVAKPFSPKTLIDAIEKALIDAESLEFEEQIQTTH